MPQTAVPSKLQVLEALENRSLGWRVLLVPFLLLVIILIYVLYIYYYELYYYRSLHAKAIDYGLRQADGCLAMHCSKK